MNQRINEFLDKHILPWPVYFLTHRFVILATIGLLIPLIVYAGNTVFVLAANSYLNTMSVAVSSIVLLYATLSEVNQKRIAEMQETRAQEDHEHVTQMHSFVVKMMSAQQEELQDLKAMLAASRGKTYKRKKASPVVDLRTLHPRGEARYEDYDVAEIMDENVSTDQFAEALGKQYRKPKIKQNND